MIIYQDEYEFFSGGRGIGVFLVLNIFFLHFIHDLMQKHSLNMHNINNFIQLPYGLQLYFSNTTHVYENCHRPQIRHVVQNGTMLSDGTCGKMNGFHEYLISKHPSVKQRISSWLTDGLKVQSIRLKNSKREMISRHKPAGKLRNNITERKLFIHRDLSEQEAEGEEIESKIFELRISSIQPSG